MNYNIIPPRTGTAFILKKGEKLTVTDIRGEQVADLVCFNQHDTAEYLSSGRTIDYAETIFLTQGNLFYSNRSNIMFTLDEDTVGRHDFLLTPCSAETFKIIYKHDKPHCGCFGNIRDAIAPYGISADQIPITFNVFMHTAIDSKTGKLDVLPPLSKAGDYIRITAQMDLIVALTACSAEMSNNYSFKEIGWKVE